MKEQTYAEKLRDPRWQKKRLQIMDRDDYKCVICTERTKTLNVHHVKYITGKEPWDYDDSLLLTLCEECHEDISRDKKKIKNQVDDIIDPFSLNQLNEIIELLRKYGFHHADIVTDFIQLIHSCEYGEMVAVDRYIKTRLSPPELPF
jgi:hypothetical protein